MIRLLNENDVEKTKHLFYHPNYMGVDLKNSNFLESEKYVELYHDNFKFSYLSGLNNYKAIGKINENGDVIGLLCFYKSTEDPSWYGTQIRSSGDKKVVRDLLDHAIDINEREGRLKFYTLWSAEKTKLLRRFAFSKYNNERYDYFDEYIVPANHKCFYTQHWHVLFNRVLIPLDTVVRCTFLKPQYRNNLIVGGKI